MVDPITAVGLATSAFNGIKQAISMGKDIQSMGTQLGQWSKAISDLNYSHEKAQKPPWWKKLGGGVEANAMEVWMQKKKADEMREELRSHISLFYGPSAWDEIVSIEAKMRKEQKEAIYAKEEMKQKILEWIFGTILVVVGVTITVFVIWLIGKGQGRW